MIDGRDVQSCTFNHQIPPRSRYFNMARRVIFINAPQLLGRSIIPSSV